MTSPADRPVRPRGRPRRDSTVAPLSRDAIAREALELAAAEGFVALTMRSLASRLGVTVRALYHHVSDRQVVIDLVAERMMALQPAYDLDPEHWRDSVRSLYRAMRDYYATMGRTLLFSLDETVTPGELHPHRIVRPEAMLTFLTQIGLSLSDALAWRGRFLTDIFGFALLIDHRAKDLEPQERRDIQNPVPRSWLDTHPEIDAPLARAATDLPELTEDLFFEQMIDRAIGDLESRLPA